MKKRIARTVAVLLAAFGAAPGVAQPPPAPAPNFAPPNTSAKGVHSMAATCAMCHGTQGKPAQGSNVAALAGRPRDEFVQSMAQFKAGQKPATIMHQIAKGYSDAEIAALADHFSKLSR